MDGLIDWFHNREALRNQGLIPSSNSRSSHATNAGRFEPYLLSIGQAISISEIFLEKLSQTFGGEASRRSAILGIESTKAILRLMVLLERQEATMLLRWGVGNNGKVLKLKDYYLWYRRQYDSHSMRSPARHTSSNLVHKDRRDQKLLWSHHLSHGWDSRRSWAAARAHVRHDVAMSPANWTL